MVLPGFIDPHFHLISSIATPVFDNVGLDRFDAVEDVLGYMMEVPQDGPEKEWLLHNYFLYTNFIPNSRKQNPA